MALAIAMLWTSAARAQNQKVEITPTAAYNFGSNFEIDDFDFGRIDLDVERTVILWASPWTSGSLAVFSSSSST